MTAPANIGNVYEHKFAHEGNMFTKLISTPGNFFIIATHLVYVQRIGIFEACITMETSQINKP